MDTADIDTLQGAQGGSAGARPKIMIDLNKAKNTSGPEGCHRTGSNVDWSPATVC
jgi:hypothetical protein